MTLLNKILLTLTFILIVPLTSIAGWIETNTHIRCHGDSITGGIGTTQPLTKSFCNLLKVSLPIARPDINWTLTCSGSVGATSAELRNNWQNCWVRSDVDLMIIMIGSNDVYYDRPLAKFESNVEWLIDQCKAKNVDVLLITVPPSNNGRDRPNKEIQQFASKVKEIAMEKSLPLVDLWDYMWKHHGTTLFSTWFYDGVHLNNAGHKLIHDLLKPAILADGKYTEIITK